MNASVLVVIPARSGSKGLPNKNIKKLGDKPLLAWPLSAINGSLIRGNTKVILSTDSAEYLDAASIYGIDNEDLRPEELSGDLSTTVDVVNYHINNCEREGEIYDFVLVLEPTSPFTTSTDIEEAYRILIENPSIERVVGIGKVKDTHPAFLNRLDDNGFLRPYLNDFGHSVRRQDIEDLYFYDGSLYLSRLESFKTDQTFYGENCYGMLFNGHKNLEIDDQNDFDLACYFMERVNEN